MQRGFLGGTAMKGKRWTVWAAAVLMLSLAAMALWAAPSFSVMEALPAPDRPGSVSAAESAVDINTAGAKELAALPGIGEVRAQAILDYRAEHGPFRYPEDLLYVPGIGEETLAGLLDLITAGGE